MKGEIAGTRMLPRDAVANNLITTEAGKVLDARQGKILHEEIQQSTANTNLNGTVTGYLPVKNVGCAIFSGDNASDVYNVMSQLVTGRCAPFIIVTSGAASLLTGGKLTSLVKGILSRTGANGQFYDFVGGPGGSYNKMYSWRIIATSDSDMTLQAVYEFTGTQL